MKIFGTKRNANHVQKKKRLWLRSLLLLLCICAALVTGAYIFLQQYVRPPEVPGFVPPREIVGPGQQLNYPQGADVEPQVQGGRPSGIYTLLIIGEENSGGGRTDSLIFAAIDTINGGLSLVNIPRDLMVDTWQGAKINSIMPSRGLDALLSQVEALVGFMPDHHVIVNLEAFVDLVNAIGGVYFDVPMRMEYDDPYRSRIVHIRLEPGRQHLDGENALNVFRFRQNNDGTGYLMGDIDRIRTQQKLLGAIAADLLQIRNVVRIRELANVFIEHVETDLPLSALLYYAMQLMDMDSGDINFLTMPGDYDYWRNGASYVLVEPTAWLEMINTHLNPYPVRVSMDNVQFLGYQEDGSFGLIGGGLALTPVR